MLQFNDPLQVMLCEHLVRHLGFQRGFNLRRACITRRQRRRYVVFDPPPHYNSAPGPPRDTQQAVFDRALTMMTKLLQSCFRSGKRSDQQMSYQVKFSFSTFFNKPAHNLGTIHRRATAHSRALLTSFP